MKKILFAPAILTLTMLLLVGCATSEHMTMIQEQGELKPPAGKSLVVFMRPSSFGGAILATVYDDMEYIGTIPANTRFSYLTEPGEHMFMVIGESADFMKADLAPDKTYHARVAARMGVWKARFSFIPYNGSEPEADLQSWLNDTAPMETNEKGEQWSIEHAASIKDKHDEYLPKWLNKDLSAQNEQTLFRSSGR